MPKPYAIELRERVVNAVLEGGASQADAAKTFSVGLKTVGRWLGLLRETNALKPAPMGGAHRACVVDEVGVPRPRVARRATCSRPGRAPA